MRLLPRCGPVRNSAERYATTLAAAFASGNRVHRRDVAVQHAVADGVGERHVPVVARRMLRQLGLEVVQVVDQRFGDRFRAEPGANVFRATLLAVCDKLAAPDLIRAGRFADFPSLFSLSLLPQSRFHLSRSSGFILRVDTLATVFALSTSTLYTARTIRGANVRKQGRDRAPCLDLLNDKRRKWSDLTRIPVLWAASSCTWSAPAGRSSSGGRYF